MIKGDDVKYELRTAGNFYREDDVEKYKEYGFDFENNDSFGEKRLYLQNHEEENTVFIEIDELKDLEKIQNDFDCNIIVNFKGKTITIYDDYME